MEAGAAGPQDTAPVDTQQTGNGIVVIAGQFEARSIAKCYHLPTDGTLRAEGGTLVGEREVNENEVVGFDGLLAGDKYIVACYSRGQYEEVRCAAVDPDVGVTLMQPPIQASPNTLGTQGTHVVDTPAAESAGASELGVGLPEGVTSPVLGGDEPASGDPTAAEDADTSPGDISGATTIAPGAAPEAPEPDREAPATPEATQPAEPQTPAPEPEAAAPAPVADPNPPAPEAGTPDASDSSGTGQANGGAVEESKAEAPVSEVTLPGVTAEAPAVPTAPADSPAESAGITTTPSQALVDQANSLGVENAATLSDDELRQAITEKQATPVV